MNVLEEDSNTPHTAVTRDEPKEVYDKIPEYTRMLIGYGCA